MKIKIDCTANLGDFCNALPVISGLSKHFKQKIHLIIRPEMRKFNGIKEFLQHQKMIKDVDFSDDLLVFGDIVTLSSWTRMEQEDADRPVETCRYENWLKDRYQAPFEVDDDFELKFPNVDLPIRNDVPYVGDRWSVGNIDERRETHILSHLTNYEFIDFNNDMLTNCYIIKNSQKPFISNFTGVGIMADLLNKETLVVWKAEDWKPEYRVGDDVSWDNGKNIDKVFEKHFYLNRKARLVHASELEKVLNEYNI